MAHVNKYKLAKLEIVTFRNGLRLHFDSIRLFKTRSYPSAFQLSVLALEEFGKAFWISHYLFYWADSPLSEAEVREWVDGIYVHPLKQRVFFNEQSAFPYKTLESAYKRIDRLEELKQNATYVGLPRKRRKVDLKGKIISPFNLRRDISLRQLSIVNNFLVDWALGSIHGYYGIDNDGVKRLLNKPLLRKLVSNWPYGGSETKAKIQKLDAWAARGHKGTIRSRRFIRLSDLPRTSRPSRHRKMRNKSAPSSI